MNLREHGFALIPGVFSSQEMEKAIGELPELESAGSRRILETEIGVQFANDSQVRRLVEADLGVNARPVRAILFDKTSQTNWTLGLHQDTKIAVKERHEIEGFINWSVKECIPHCQPPVEFLQQSLAVRIHLDPCPEQRGALVVVPGTHLQGFSSPTSASEVDAMVLPCDQGDVILMKPLTYHGSKAATEPGHRRVLHIEYCAVELPSPLLWAY